MVKKIMKYSKFMICIILMVSLIAPSYAALSASDGSAFVTKAEFDSALADFNARLTTFEAGINSKIDSQVTSYLDRNGIWNGKDQLLKWSSTSSYVPCPKSFNGGFTTDILMQGEAASSMNKEVLSLPSDWCICSKSGLFVLTLQNSRQDYLYTYEADVKKHNRNWAAWTWSLNVTNTTTSTVLAYFAMWAGSAVFTARTPDSTTYSNGTMANYSGVFVPQAPWVNSMLFFVSKDDHIRLEERVTKMGNTTSTRTGKAGNPNLYTCLSAKIY